MRKYISITYRLLSTILLWVVLPASAQSWLDYDQALARYPLLRTSNAAALTTYHPTDSTQRLLGDARLTISTGQGHLEGPDVSPHAWAAGAQVRSIYRMSRRVVVSGAMHYNYGWGSQCGGSVWIDPERMPFDITETNDTTLGNMSLETYRLIGDVGVNIGHGMSLGGCFDYTTASGAKKKDPRHTNTLMRCAGSVGAMWQTGNITLGANYLVERSTEALKVSTVGRTDQVYHYLIDHGAYFGREESTDGNGYVGTTNEHPLLDIKHGVAFLADYRHGLWDWGIEGQWRHRHGHYGLESPSLIDFNRHHGDEWDITAWGRHDDGCRMQRIGAYYRHSDIKDYERTYRIITTQGVTDVNYYDDRLMSDNGRTTMGINAEAQWGIRRQLATWTVLATLQHNRRSVTASVYPFYRQQKIHFTEVTLQGGHNWLTGNDHVWSLMLLAGWGNGGGNAARDGVYQTPAADTSAPHDYLTYRMREFEHLSAQRLQCGAQVRWSIPVNRQRMRLYAEGQFIYSQAFDIHYLQDGYRIQAALSIGCQF